MRFFRDFPPLQYLLIVVASLKLFVAECCEICLQSSSSDKLMQCISEELCGVKMYIEANLGKHHGVISVNWQVKA